MPLKFNQYPYYDDFTPDNLYYRLLFQPGRAVQARELTQIQSLLQNQISNFGNHIFKDGSAVVGGNITYDRTHTHWLAVKSQDAYGNSVRIRDISPGMLIKKSAEGGGKGTLAKLVGRIVNVIPAENQDPDTIYFKWIEGEPQRGVKSEDDVSGFDADENLIICDSNGSVKYTVTTLEEDAITGPRHYGTASTISVEPGIYFWKGMFIKAAGGGVTLFKYNNNPTFIVGYIVNEEVIQNDAKSYDPSQETSNYSAPGADRYKISLSFVKTGNGLVFDETLMPNFFEVARIDTGMLLTAPPDRTLYSVLADSLATRTFEESGNYIAEPYIMDGGLQNKTTPDGPKMVARLTEGVSYVKGYRHSLRSLNPIQIDKARDELTESVNIQNDYGDNYLSLYDYANTDVSHPENANGFFAIGSGAGQYTSNDWFGQKGAAVSLHCVPHALVINHSLTDQWKWESTLIGTARPIQMVRNKNKTKASNDVQRPGDVYDLWLGDFKSSPISNTTSVTNIITDVSAYGNSSWSVYRFPSQSHGLTANDRFSITGATVSDWNVDFFNVDAANSVAIMSNTALHSGLTAITDGGLTIYRTTGNTNPNRTIVLDTDSSAAWNDSYVGATISVGNSVPRVITGYIGTNSRAETLHNEKFGWSKKGMVSVNLDLSQTPSYGDSYTLNLTMKQARSVVYNQNITANGTDAFPARLATAWSLDPVSGISGGESSKLTDDFYGGRIDGDALYNRHGETSRGIDALLFGPHRQAVKTVKTYGELDTGFSSNTTVYYIESSIESATATNPETFAVPAAVKYLGTNRPKCYPYGSATIGHASAPTASALEEIRNNFTLHNRTTGQILTRKIIKIVVPTAGDTIQVTTESSSPFVVGQEYVLNYPVRVENLSPAYKKLITSANSTAGYTSIPVPSTNDLTDYSKGHVTISSYSTTAGSRIKLNKPDGFKLRKVVQGVDSSTANVDIANSMLDVTNRFNFDNGQRDMFYDNCSLVLKDDVNAPTGNLWIGFDYFQRMDSSKGTGGIAENLDSPSYFSVDSYQWTTDLILSEVFPTGGDAFSPGDKVVSNSNIAAYVLEYANTSGYAKVRVQDLTGTRAVGGNAAAFTVGETIVKGASSGKIKEIITADLKYTEIPKHTTGGEKTFLLRNWLDFRPYVTSNGRVSDTISDAIMPTIPTRAGIVAGRNKKVYPTLDHPIIMKTSATIKSYGGRIDKMIVQADGNYTTIKGIPAVKPLPPRDLPDADALTLFTMEIPPYTPDPKHVQIKTNLAVRHTMKDISRLAKRVENLEYYVSLNTLEKAAADLVITDANGLERFKNGIVVDDFTGMTVMDRRKNRQRATIGKGVLRSKQTGSPAGTHDIQFTEDESDLSGVTAGNPSPGRHVLTLDYAITPAITQPYATMPESVNPFDLQNFTGELKLSPDYDRWIDITKVPEYDVVFRGANESIVIDENSDPQQIVDAIYGIDELWEQFSLAVGDNANYVEGTAITAAQTEDGTFELDNISRDISLGGLGLEVGTVPFIQEAINQHGMNDGVTKNMQILPYIRSRDIIVHAGGLKPNYAAGMLFAEVAVEQFFSPATAIYMRYDDDELKQFQPEIDGTYEIIELSDPAGPGRTATATLVAVRDLAGSYQDKKTQSEKMKIGYIVPIIDEETGKIDHSTYKDGYYSSSWEIPDVKNFGFQGLSGSRRVSGLTSGTKATLTTGGDVHLYNGHYSGHLRNQTSNTTHLVLSPDASRYVANNFGNDVIDRFTGTPRQTLITIVAGAGAGQQCLANTIVGTEQSGCSVLDLIQPLGSGSTGISPTEGQGNKGPVDGTSVYSICMRPIDPNIRSHGVSQLGSFGGLAGNFTNSYGDKIGILHLPESTRTEWTRGRKLVEVVDRLSKTPWLVSSYASAYYFAEGMEQDVVQSSAKRLEILKEIRSKMNLFQLDDFPMNDSEQMYVPATNNRTSLQGKLAVVTEITVANGTYTGVADHGIPYLPGSTEYGSVAERTQSELKYLVTGAWDHIKETQPQVYAKYFAVFEDTIED